MANVPPELFRRRMAFRALENLHTKMTDFEAWAGNDSYYAAMASYNDMAAHFAARCGRPDLARVFEDQRDEMIAKGTQPKPTMPGAPKGTPHRKKKTDPSP